MRINNKKIIFLLFLSSLAYSKEEMKKENKIEGEVTFGIDASFGVDGAETLVRMFPPMIDVLKPYQFSDYENILKDEGTNSEIDPNLEEPKTFRPKYEGLNRDLELAVKYLSKNIELKKRMGIKLKEKYIGLGFGVDVSGKQMSHTEFLGNNEIEKIKVSLSLNNKYINGDVNVYIKGESKEKVDIDKIDVEEKLENKVVDYSFKINPIVDKKYTFSLDFDGKNKKVYYGPTFRYENSGIYLNTSLIFNNVKENYDVSRQLDKIKYTAPGYNKIEYFKKWTQKEEYTNPKKEYTKEEYDLDRANLETAEVSGFKGTTRILGHYSGSLFGDSPFRLIPKIIFDEIENNSNFKNLNSVIKVFEKKEAPKEETLLNAGVHKLGSELNKDAINGLINKVGEKIYDRLGINKNRRYSSIGIWNQIPKEFAYLLPGFSPDFDYSKIKIKELEADYLYNNKLRDAYIPESLALMETGRYNLENKWHYFGEDINKYVINELYKSYKIDKIINLANTSTGGLVIDAISDLFLGGGKISEVIGYLPLLQDVIKDPYEIKNVDMLRAFYFHQSEKEKNISLYEKKLKSEFSDVDLKDNKATYSTKLRVNFGNVGKNYNIGAGLILNDNINVVAPKYGYIKKSNHLGFDTKYKESLIDFNTNIILTIAKNNLFRKDNQTRFIYNTVDLNTDTYFGLDIPATKNLTVGMGVRHIGEFGWINPKVIKDSKGDILKWNNIAKRDVNNNPIGLDGKAIIISETTEKVLVDKVAEGTNKLKRDIHQSDYIQKEESDSVKSMFEVYNIVSPRIIMKYRPYNNFIFTSHLEVPISMRKNYPAGIRWIYAGEIKYLLDDSFSDIIKIKTNPLKFKKNGHFESGLIMGSDLGYYLNYKAMADATVLRADINGNNKNIDFSLSFNPLIVNFPIKPRLIFAKEDEKLVTKYGLEYSKDTEFSSIIGFKNVIKSNKNIIKDELVPNILEVLKDRNKNEYEKMSELLPKKMDIKLKYMSTPFIDIKKEEGDFKLSVKANSLKAYGESKAQIKSVIKGKEKQIPDAYKKINDYFAWANTGSWGYYYLVNVEYEKVDREFETNKLILDYEKYKFDINTSYEKDKGLIFNTSLDIDYSDIKLLGVTEEIKVITKRAKPHSTQGSSSDIGYRKEEIENPENVVLVDENNILQSFNDHIRKRAGKNQTLYIGNRYTKATNENLKKALEGNVTKEIKEDLGYSMDKFLLESKKITGKFDTYLGYKFNRKEKMIFSIGARYNLDINYLSINKILLNEIALFGSRKIDISNEITPEFSIKYDIFKGLNTKLKVNMPFKFVNKEFKGAKFNINTGLEYSW